MPARSPSPLNTTTVSSGLASLMPVATPVRGRGTRRFFRRRHAGPQRGANIEVELTIPLEKVASGGAETVRLARPVPCPACHGSGAKAGTEPRRCETCGGSGRLTQSRRQEKEHVLIQQITTCPACHGQGTFIDQPCPDCQGSGKGGKEESLTVTIPPGVEEGMAHRPG